MLKATNVTCPGCGCVCDDLAFAARDGQVIEVEPSCPIAERWFKDNSRHVACPVSVGGRPASLEAGLARAAEILNQARLPLVYGLSRSSTPGQRAACALADRLGAIIDTTASLCHGPSIMALQNAGESTCSLGEVRNRCDLVIFWGCNPAQTHPRHAERYSVFPRGQFVTQGRKQRTVVMLGDSREVHDWRLDLDGSQPDTVIPIEPGQDFEAITTLRLMLRGEPVAASGSSRTGACITKLRDLAKRMKACRSGIVFFGLGLTGTSFDQPTLQSLGHANVESLLRMVAELNAHTRFYARRMRIQGDVSGADSVLCWQTGFPFSVSLSRGYPRYNPGEYSANDLLAREEVDACLIVGTETLSAFSSHSLSVLRNLPTIVLDYPERETSINPSVQFTTAPYGLFAAGTAYRMDEVPLPLRKFMASDLPTDEEVLKQLHQRCDLR